MRDSRSGKCMVYPLFSRVTLRVRCLPAGRQNAPKTAKSAAKTGKNAVVRRQTADKRSKSETVVKDPIARKADSAIRRTGAGIPTAVLMGVPG